MVSYRRVQELYHSYIVIENNPDITAMDYGYNMMMHQSVPYLAAFQNRSRDKISEYYYDVTGYTSLQDLAHKKINEQILDHLVQGLCDVMESIEDYLLDCNDMVMDISTAFYSQDGAFRFIYYPGYQTNFVSQLKCMAEQILTIIDYTSDTCVKKAYKLYHLTCDEQNALKHLKSFFIGEEPVKEIVVEALTDPPMNYSEPKQEENPQTDENDNKKMPIGFWFLFVLGDGAFGIISYFIMYIWLFNDVLLSVVCAVGVGAILAVTEILVIRNRYTDTQKDFWKPEDYVDIEGVSGWNHTTAATTLLQPKGFNIAGAEVLFSSVHKERWPDIKLCEFPAIIGKDNIRLPIVSRRHARIEKSEEGIYITDLGSTNGTFINGEMIPPGQRILLKHKDNVIFADLEFVFELTARK